MNSYSYELGVVGAFSELIQSGVKQLAISAPLSPEEMDRFIKDAERIASRYEVLLYREPDLITTDLFPAQISKGKEVLLLYRGTTLEQYLSLKSDKAEMEKAGTYERQARIDLARRFGRLLSYSPREINRKLAQNTSFRTMDDFGIQASNLFLYYCDLNRALNFYTEILGMEAVAEFDNAHVIRMAADSYLILVDADKGMHSAEEAKTVAIALLTSQLDEWYHYLGRQNVEIKFEYKPRKGSAHDGFVAVDPEGYLLEFERFNQHPENEKFIPLLDQNKQIEIRPELVQGTTEGLSIHSTISWLYYKDLLGMQNFYQDVLGLEVVADQGWTKIFRVSRTGFLGIVDERRGMHSFSEEKAVNVGFILEDLEAWFAYVKENKPFALHEDELGTGPEGRYKAFVGYCPEGYYLEFDHFYSHEGNSILLDHLNK
jgi:catechol 2,3-dioxygenase-like lactoylglutathione lyase family enzyme